MYRLIILILALTVANMPFATSDAQTKKKTTTTAVAKKKPVRKASTAAKGGKRNAAKGGKKRTAKGKRNPHTQMHRYADCRTSARLFRSRFANRNRSCVPTWLT